MYLLPNEVWCRIFRFLDSKSRNEAKLVCQLWLDLIKNDTRPKHLIFDNIFHHSQTFEVGGEFDWNYKWILKIISERPYVKICEFKSYGKCQFYGKGFENFIEKAKSMGVVKFIVEGILQEFVANILPSWPQWMIITELELKGLEIDEKRILEMIVYLPGIKMESENLMEEYGINSISEECLCELFEILPKLINLQLLRINFESCDVIFSEFRFIEMFDHIPKTHLKFLNVYGGSLSNISETAFEDSLIPLVKSKFLPDTKIEIYDFKTGL